MEQFFASATAADGKRITFSAAYGNAIVQTNWPRWSTPPQWYVDADRRHREAYEAFLKGYGK